MTEIFRNKGYLGPEGKAEQELVDAYHPKHPVAILVKAVRKPPAYGGSAYLEAQAEHNRTLLAEGPHVILPHYPCG